MVAETIAKKLVQQYTLDEYLELEEKAAFKREFRNISKMLEIPI